MVNKYFVESEPIWDKENIESSRSLQIDSSTAQYTGGIIKVISSLINLFYKLYYAHKQFILYSLNYIIDAE